MRNESNKVFPKTITLHLIIIFFCVRSYAQNAPITEAQMLYMNDYQFGINANTHGLGGISFRYGWHKTGLKNKILETELSIIQHPKEVKRDGYNNNPSQYKFGKLNNVFFWRIGYGNITNITERSYKNALGLNFIYAGGLNLALLKPYYLDVIQLDKFKTPNVVSSKFVPDSTNEYNIYGSSSFAQGLGETTLKLGAYGRLALAVEWGQYPDEYKTIEAGFVLDGFSDGIPILYGYTADKYFAGFYLAFNWGWKN